MDISKKYEKELQFVLVPCSAWKQAYSQAEEAAAKAALTQALAILRQIRPTKCRHIPWTGRMAYLTHLFMVEQPLRRLRYTEACHELVDLIHFNPVAEHRILFNLIELLSEHLEG